MSAEQIQVATCKIKRPMNSYGALTLTSVSGCRTFQVVDYGSPRIQAALARRDPGETVRVRLQRVKSRGEAWRVTELNATVDRVKPRQSPSPSNGPAGSARSSSKRLPPLR